MLDNISLKICIVLSASDTLHFKPISSAPGASEFTSDVTLGNSNIILILQLLYCADNAGLRWPQSSVGRRYQSFIISIHPTNQFTSDVSKTK